MDSLSVFPFQKLRHDIYLTLEVMMYIQHYDAKNLCLLSIKKQETTF
jgi:hypothetical protein